MLHVPPIVMTDVTVPEPKSTPSAVASSNGSNGTHGSNGSHGPKGALS
jgi:hypothetical protein